MEMPHPNRPPVQRARSPFALVLGQRLGRLLPRFGRTPQPASGDSLLDLAGGLLSLRGRASGPSLASAFFDLYEASDLAARQAFLAQLHDLYPRDRAAIGQAIAQWQERGDETAAAALNEASESPSQRLIRLLNLAPGGTRRLIAMREDLLAAPTMTPGLEALDREFEDVFATWFNAGFLELRRIDWNAPAALLERIIRYEAVHEIDGWDELRRRVEPVDRRCYGFFHPQMADDPLIFVEVALTLELPSSIRQVIALDRATLDPHEASCAIFYSISNCQTGLRGIPFGNFLIKQVVGVLCQELPQLSRFATLSPVPGFARWLGKELDGAPVPEGDALRAQAARYLVTARNGRGEVLDSVARFHLGNGARLEAVHSDGDLSPKGMQQSHGIMVNYLYDLAEIEANLFGLAELGTVATSRPVQELLGETSVKNGKNRKRAA
ncbi:MAG: malonyl-CoA decarboxylase [Novosphingobium sp.]|nr:malonyl-CoA decarboxylase [Novosphingobium sp.]